MAKDKDLLNRFGANLAESMGAGRPAKGSGGSPAPVTSGSGKHDGVSRLRAGAEIEVGKIMPDPDQPRTEFDPEAITRLAESLKSHGQLQPISVRWSDPMGRYLIVTGERRWRASIQAGRSTIAAVILEGERVESQVLELQLIENCLREDLQPIEQARAFRTLMDRNGWSATKLAEALQLTGASVTRALALLDLPIPCKTPSPRANWPPRSPTRSRSSKTPSLRPRSPRGSSPRNSPAPRPSRPFEKPRSQPGQGGSREGDP